MKSPLPLRTRASGFSGSVVSLAILLVCLASAGWLVFNRQYALDQVTVWQYHPSSDVQAIATRAQMNDHGRFYFYASQPEVDQASAFNKQCKKQEEHSAILGCYSARRIYIYNVSDARLDGIKEVTAAHEMLHAAWDRLSAKEQERLKQLLTAQYDKVATPELEQRMAYYERTQPGESVNELHSILGTEIVDLGDELEQYYAQYFTDRKQVAALHQQYQAQFTKLDQQATALETQLTALGTQIEQQSASYNQAVSQLNTDITDFNNRAQSGSFSSQAEFNQQRNALVARSSALDVQRTDINSKIEQYNALRSQLEAVNSQSEALNRSIDSSLSPAPAI